MGAKQGPTHSGNPLLGEPQRQSWSSLLAVPSVKQCLEDWWDLHLSLTQKDEPFCCRAFNKDAAIIEAYAGTSRQIMNSTHSGQVMRHLSNSTVRAKPWPNSFAVLADSSRDAAPQCYQNG